MRAARRAVHNRGAIAMFAFGTKRTFVFQLEPISDVDQTHTTAHQELVQHDGSSVARVKCIVQIDACEYGEHISLQESHQKLQREQ